MQMPVAHCRICSDDTCMAAAAASSLSKRVLISAITSSTFFMIDCSQSATDLLISTLCAFEQRRALLTEETDSQVLGVLVPNPFCKAASAASTVATRVTGSVPEITTNMGIAHSGEWWANVFQRTRSACTCYLYMLIAMILTSNSVSDVGDINSDCLALVSFT